jgi:Protein of unknown function (DUF4242)
MNLYVILRRRGWATSEELQAAARRSVEEGERRSDRVRWIRSYVLAEQAGGLGTACVYEAVSPEPVREHAAAAGLPCDEVIEVSDTVVAREDPVRTG